MEKSFPKGIVNTENNRIICKTCGYVGESEHDYDTNGLEKLFICPTCDEIIGVVSMKELQPETPEQNGTKNNE